MTKTKKEVKVTICPPAKQTVFFQEVQFDEELPGRGGLEGSSHADRGTDPVRYLRGDYATEKSKLPSGTYGSKARETKLKKAEKELEGHENKKEIIKILRSGL
jgi:hypothetical protein